ncbi:MAG: DNA-binding transcriptional regulator [Phycisphaerae bacterium]|nr:DNA-binding transcriptional regulator [Phycisphaerae bacterium]
MAKEPRVILLIVPARAFDRALLRGIARYANEHGPWTFLREPAHYRPIGWKKKVLDRLHSGQVDGLIMREPERIEDILKMHIPGICAPVTQRTVDGMINVVIDNEAVGRMGAEHLLERGFRHFAYCGFEGIYWSEKRCQGFASRIRQAGFKVDVYAQPRSRDIQGLWEMEQPVLADWLQGLPKPVGLMTCNDDRSQHVSETCHAARLHVPNDIAIIGVDNDEFVCEMANPPLSSVCLNAEAIGYRAAATLHEVIAGRAVEDTTIIGGPTYIVARKSTDIMLIDDAVIARALRHIRQSTHEPIQVIDVAEVLAISRRSLEQRFRRVVGRSVHEQILYERVDRIMRLLLETRISISQIAHILNFSSTKQLDRVFSRYTGMNPSEYRKQYCIK